MLSFSYRDDHVRNVRRTGRLVHVWDWAEIHTALWSEKMSEKLRGILMHRAVKPLKWILMKADGDDVVLMQLTVDRD